MKKVWKLQDAKAQFSRMVDNAVSAGPQFVTRRGQKAVVVMSITDYEELTTNKPSFKEFLLTCPKAGDVVEFERQSDFPRGIDL